MKSVHQLFEEDNLKDQFFKLGQQIKKEKLEADKKNEEQEQQRQEEEYQQQVDQEAQEEYQKNKKKEDVNFKAKEYEESDSELEQKKVHNKARESADSESTEAQATAAKAAYKDQNTDELQAHNQAEEKAKKKEQEQFVNQKLDKMGVGDEENGEEQESEEEGEEESMDPYHRLFNQMLDKYDVEDPADLDDDQRKEFFNQLDQAWKSDEEVGGEDSEEGEEEEYSKLFNQLLKQYDENAEDPADLDKETRKKFFNELDKRWKSDKEQKNGNDEEDVEENTDTTNDKDEYNKLFNQMLQGYGVDDPGDLDKETRKEFFDKLDKQWKSEKETKQMQENMNIFNGLRNKEYEQKFNKLLTEFKVQDPGQLPRHERKQFFDKLHNSNN